MADRKDWAGERGDHPQLSEAQVRGSAYFGERPLDGGVAGAACSYPYMLEEKRPEAPLFEGDYHERYVKIRSRYPDNQGALLPVLNLAQEVRGWVSSDTMDRVAELLELSPSYVRGVATFYTMYNKRPVGRHLIQVCTNVCCNICGADDVMEAFLEKTGTEAGEISEDGLFTVIEAECLGACGFPTAVQINSRYYEDVTADEVPAILEDLRSRDARPVELRWDPELGLHEVAKDPMGAIVPGAETMSLNRPEPAPDRSSPALQPGGTSTQEETQPDDRTADAPSGKGIPGGGVGADSAKHGGGKADDQQPETGDRRPETGSGDRGKGGR